MKNEDQLVRDAMRDLISKSCGHASRKNSEAYQFQKALLKFFFGVADVSIDYDRQTITLWNADYTDNNAIYSLAETKRSKVSYTNLEETLKGCIEKGDAQTRFYRSALYHYNHVNDGEKEFMSA